MQDLPTNQTAIQLVGPDQIRLNPQKPVPWPIGRQALAQVEAVGLCFSDMKLLHQFDTHVRKGRVVSGADPQMLAALPSYVPGKEPTVPGHEAVVRIVAVGPDAQWLRPGQRYIVQADFRTVRTENSNGAFGYNFEGALQEYTLFDESIVGDPKSPDSYLIPAPEGPSASSMALVEPWGCVENSYSTEERQGPKPGGSLLLFGAAPEQEAEVLALYSQGAPARIERATQAEEILAFDDQAFDDAVLFRPTPEAVEAVSDKLANRGIANLVMAGGRLGRPCTIGVGRIHYGYCRWIGTVTEDPADGYSVIPKTGEIRDGDFVLVVGAGGPMGQMHVIRTLMGGKARRVVGADVDDTRIATLEAKCRAFPHFQAVNASKDYVGAGYSYAAIMAPVPELVADAMDRCGGNALVNVFAGIPVGVKHPMDVDQIVAKRLFLFGTSGSETRDMKSVLGQVVENRLNTDASVAAICGMAGAEAGLRAVQERTIEGKIVVYPSLTELGLVPLAKLQEALPDVAAKLADGNWSLEAERQLLKA